jgi:hypothetical protein
LQTTRKNNDQNNKKKKFFETCCATGATNQQKGNLKINEKKSDQKMVINSYPKTVWRDNRTTRGAFGLW